MKNKNCTQKPKVPGCAQKPRVPGSSAAASYVER